MDNIQIPIASVSRRGSGSSCTPSTLCPALQLPPFFPVLWGGGISPGALSVHSMKEVETPPIDATSSHHIDACAPWIALT
ncbi:Uncharacterized protein FKW44_004607, partial [Caligus rogercresseyi]